MVNPSLQQHEGQVIDSSPSPSSSSRLEREPLLPPFQQIGSSPGIRSDIENGNETDTTLGDPAVNPIAHLSRAKLVAVMLDFFVMGVSGSSIGALIGGIETSYHITDGPVSLIFPTGTAGYLLAAWMLPKILNVHGWRGIALTAPVCRLLSSIILSFGPPFPFVILAYFILGLGLGISDSGFCAWASKVPRANVVQGLMHGSFSIGAVLGPVLVVSVTGKGFDWYIFYRLVAVLSCFEFAVFATAFRADNANSYHDSLVHDSATDTKPTILPLRLVAVWICGAFYFLYIGIESSFTDWSVEYMKRIRHLDIAMASLSSSIFWIGMSVGRLSLGPVTEKFGLRKSVSTYIALSTIFQILFKYTPDAVFSLGFLGINGFFLGPMYPSAIILLAKKVPSRSKIGAIATAASMGQVGGALVPAAIGFLADSFGIGRMLDIILALSLVLLITWFAFCRLPYVD